VRPIAHAPTESSDTYFLDGNITSARSKTLLWIGDLYSER
jgi:hypothetical protein